MLQAAINDQGQVSPELRSVFVEVSEHCTLPPLPQVAARALVLVQNPETDFAEMAEVIEKDPALAARVLRIASSAFYVRTNPPTTLQDAVRAVGMSGLRDIIVAAALKPAFDLDDRFHRQLWDHSLATAVAADTVARTTGASRGGVAFICGLLHDAGRLVHHLTNPKAFDELHMAERDEPSMDEREYFGASHDVVASCLAWKWGLDPRISNALIAHHGEPGQNPGLSAHLILGDRIARAIQGDPDEERALSASFLAADLDADPATVVAEVERNLAENRAFFE